MNKIKNIFAQGDAFGTTPKLFIDHSTKFKTSFGSFFTFLLGLIVAGACWIYGKDLYYKLNPNSIFTEESTLHPEYFQITKDKFNLAFGITRADWIHYIDESIYTIKMQREIYTNYKNPETGEIEPKHEILDLNARRCKSSDFGLAPEYFQNLAFLNDLYCMDNYENSFIEGDYGAEMLSMINGVVQPCKNSTETEPSNIICKSQEVIDEALKDTFWAFYFTDSFINPKNFTHPFDITGRNEYGFCSNSMFRSLDFYFRNVYMEDNTGIIFDSWSNKRGIQYSFYKEMSKNEPKDDGTFLTFSVRFEKVKQTRIYRTYLNMAQVLANVGGVLKVFMLAFLIISQFVANKYYNINVANSLFGFKYSKPNKEKDIKNSKSNSNKKNNNSSNKNSNDNQNQLKFNSFLNLFSSFWQSEETKTQQKMLDFSVAKLSYHLDVKRILQKLIELDKLKMLLLNDNQVQLFEYLPKPEITEEMILEYEYEKKKKEKQIQDSEEPTQIKKDIEQKKQKKLNILEEDKRSQEEKHKDAFTAFKLLKQKSKGKIDNRLLQIMDEKLRKKFEKEFEEELKKNPQNFNISINQSKQNFLANNIQNFNDSERKEKSYNYSLSSAAVDNYQTLDKENKENAKTLQYFEDFEQQEYNDINSERLQQSTKLEKDTFNSNTPYNQSQKQIKYSNFNKRHYSQDEQIISQNNIQNSNPCSQISSIQPTNRYFEYLQNPSKKNRYRGQSYESEKKSSRFQPKL